jgi:gamma-glutamyltranspeptidase/glutathione hydrolase
MLHVSRATVLASVAALSLLAPAIPAAASATPVAAPAAAGPPKTPTAVGRGGAVSTVDPYATRVGLRVLRDGGNAVDAAVATAAALGVTEPYSAGLGGGGFFVYHDARSGKVHTIDGRETAPREMPRDAFIDPETGEPYNFTPELVTSGVSVGVPGTPATWQRALDRWGTRSLARSLRPAATLAERGFVVDETFHQQTVDNQLRFDAIRPTRSLFLPGGEAPAIGSRFRNPDLAKTYRLLGDKGLAPLYRGGIADQIVDVVRRPPKTEQTDLPVPPGFMRQRDLARYDVVDGRPTHVRYRGHDVYGMPPSSSGGIAVGEALNILEQFDVGAMTDVDALHHYLEASSLAFADRAEYVGDSAYVDVPQRALLSDRFAKERACSIVPGEAQPKPFPAGDVTAYDGECDEGVTGDAVSDHEGLSTTNLTVSDKWGNVVEYTLTIEQTGGSAIVVPHRGFILNNELTDFSLEYDPEDPNRIQPGKRPRSSMSPTIVLDDGKPFLALGSPGGSTIITTVLQMLVNRIDRGMTIEEAMAAPRTSPRNATPFQAEQAFRDTYGALLEAYGHQFTTIAELGAATAIEFGPGGLLTAVAEPERRGGGAAAVVSPAD